MSKVIITDCDHSNIEMETSILNKTEIPFQLKQCKTENDVIEQCKSARVLINQYAPITRKVMNQLENLEMVVRYGVGVNNIDLEAATHLGIQICNVPDYGMHEVADHALAMMLNFTRKIYQMDQSVKQGIWDYQKSIPIMRHSEMTVGIIGVGRIGTSFAKKVHALGCEVIASDTRYDREKYSNKLPFIEMTNLQDLLERSDVVSIHCPLDKAHHLIGESELRAMKRTAYLINVSRGGIINEEALEKALEEKWIAGAALDVTEIEPLDKHSKLLTYENFICTPHMAWYSEQAAEELKRKVSEEAVRFICGEEIHYPVNHLN